MNIFKKRKLFFVFTFFFLCLICFFYHFPSFGKKNFSRQKIEKEIYSKNYRILKKKINNVPDVVEFFSFLCPHCYELEYKLNIGEIFKDNLGLDIDRYHININNDLLGSNLSRSWILLKNFKVDYNKSTIIIFNKIIHNKNLNFNEVKKIFMNLLGIKKVHNFNKLYYSNKINNKFFLEKKIIDLVNVNSVPLFLVKGKYIVGDKIIASSFFDYIIKCIEVIVYLL